MSALKVCATIVLLESFFISRCEGENNLMSEFHWCVGLILPQRSLTKGEFSLYIRTGCCGNVFVSSDRGLLSLDNITALHDSNQMMTYPVRNIVSMNTSNGIWCANSTVGNYVNMTFNQPVVVEGIFSHGAVSSSLERQHYVSNFTILFSQDVSGQLQQYYRVYWTNNAIIII